MQTRLPSQSVKLVVEMTHELQTEAAIAWMKWNEADNVKRAAETRGGYKRLSQEALALAERARVAALANMDDVARARVAGGLPAYGPVSEDKQKV